MRLAIVIPRLTGGGAERVASLMSIHLSKKHDVTLVVMNAEGATYPHGGTLVDLGLRDIALKGIFRRLKNTIWATFKLRRFKRASEIPIFISLLELANIPNILSGGRHNIVSIRNARLMVKQHDLQRRITNQLIRLLYKRAAKVVAVSAGVRTSLHRDFGLPPSKTLSIPNPLDQDTIEKQAAEELGDKCRDIFTRPVLITSGRLDRQKGQWHLIRAFARARKAVPDMELVVLGSGELRGYLEKLSRELDIQKHVHFLGFKSNPFKYLAHATAFAFPSLWEGFPNALIEAMACGLPVLASDCVSGPREILAPISGTDHVAHGIELAPHGILLPVCDGRLQEAGEPLTAAEAAWADAITSLFTDKDLGERYAANARMRAGDFAIGRVMGEWERLIEECGGY